MVCETAEGTAEGLCLAIHFEMLQKLPHIFFFSFPENLSQVTLRGREQPYREGLAALRASF